MRYPRGSQRSSSRCIVRKIQGIRKAMRTMKARHLSRKEHQILDTESRAHQKKSKKRQRERLGEASHVPGKHSRRWSTSARMRLQKRKKRQRKREILNPLIRERAKGRARLEEEDIMRTKMKNLLSSLQPSMSIVPGTGDAQRRKKSTSRLRQ